MTTRKKPLVESLDDVVVLVIGDRCWGKAKTLDDALQNASRPKNYQVFLTHKTTYVDDMGYVMFNTKFAPREILRKGVRPGKEFFRGQEDESSKPKKAHHNRRSG